MDGRKLAPGEPNQDWVERLQWLGIKVEEPQGNIEAPNTSV